jgi:hypothetical protein
VPRKYEFKRPRVYMAVTLDEFELPIYSADSMKELSELSGVREQTIRNSLIRDSSGKKFGMKFIKVILDEEDKEF